MPKVQDRGGIYYFPNEEVGITANSVCVYKDAYGRYQSKGKLINGKKDGKWTWWYEDGKWTWLWNANDQLKSEGSYISGKLDGKSTRWHENGQKELEGNYKDGREDGKWTTWHSNGQIKSETNYKDGKLDGKWTGWYRNGQIKSEINYKDGKQDGKWTGWYENGQIAYEANYINGKPDGKWTEWWGNGQLKSERNYKDGKLDGKWTEWHENGQLQLERIFQDGKLVLWDENSQSKEAYKDGKLLAPLAPWYERYRWLLIAPLLILVYVIRRVNRRHTSSKKTSEVNQITGDKDSVLLAGVAVGAISPTLFLSDFLGFDTSSKLLTGLLSVPLVSIIWLCLSGLRNKSAMPSLRHFAHLIPISLFALLPLFFAVNAIMGSSSSDYELLPGLAITGALVGAIFSAPYASYVGSDNKVALGIFLLMCLLAGALVIMVNGSSGTAMVN